MATTGAPFPDIRPPLAEGWRGGEKDGVRRTAMDQGPKKARVESTAPGVSEPFRFKCNAADRAALSAHYDSNKALRFAYEHPIWGDVEATYAAAIAWSKSGRWMIAEVQMEIYR